MHAGFGATLAGHGHPTIVAAVAARVAAGTHFAQPVPDIVPVATELARRFGLPMWRFTNSGTESTLAAIHLIRTSDRAHPPHQGRGLVPRSSRRGAGVGLPGRRRLRVPGSPGHRPRARRRPAGGRRPRARRAVRTRRRRPPRAPRTPRCDRRHDRRARDDEHRGRPAATRLPRRAADAAAPARRPAHVRRGEDRADDRTRRGHRVLRRRARHRLPGQGARRGRAVWRDRWHGRGDGDSSPPASTSRSARSTATR